MFIFFLFQNNKKITYLVFLLLFFLLLPLSTMAFLSLQDVLFALPLLLINAFLILIVNLTYVFALIMGAILDLVISPSFISLKYTDPAGNLVIKAGLNVTQSFVNMLLIVILIYTALSIALRINETQAKKILARLIIVALLANFAPVFCGLIVDASNIVMYYFLESIQAGPSGTLLQMDTKKTVAMIESAGINASKQLGVMGAAVGQIIFNVGVTIAFFLFCGIFLVRYIAIWILVILAPLAFVCWIFPSGKIRAFWDMWFKNLIEWSIIGIPCAFFLYLAIGTFSVMTAAFIQKMTIPNLEEQTTSFLDQIFPYIVTVVFLFLGFIIGLKSSAIGADATISYTKRAGRAGGRLAGRAGKWTMRKTIGRKNRDFWEKQAAANFLPQKIAEMKGVKGTLAKTAYGLTAGVPLWAIRRGVGKATLAVTESEIKGIKSAEEKAKGTLAERKASAITSQIASIEDRIGYLNQAIEEEQISALRKAGIDDNTIIALGREALAINPRAFAKIRDAFPHLVEKMAEGFSEQIKRRVGLTFISGEEETFKGSITAKIIANLSSDKVRQLDPNLFKAQQDGYFENGKAGWAISKFWNPKRVITAAERFGQSFVNPFNKEAKGAGHDWYKQHNSQLGDYLKSNAAQSLGLGPIPNIGSGLPPRWPESSPPAS